jgi:hypothetical protein
MKKTIIYSQSVYSYPNKINVLLRTLNTHDEMEMIETMLTHVCNYLDLNNIL